jgi:hypothetical protein
MAGWFYPPMRSDLLVVRRRGPLARAAVAAPLFSLVAARALVAALRRALGRHHPHGWTLQEELLITLMRTLLAHGDLAVWRAFFRSVSDPAKRPPSVVMVRAARPGGRSVWFTLSPELRPAAPRARLNLVFIHGGRWAGRGGHVR